LILKLESFGQLEIELNGSTLMGSFESIEYMNIDFRAIESSISRIKFPGVSKLIEAGFKCLLCFIPDSDLTQKLLGSSGKLQRKNPYPNIP
jgi:hypothetical protein